MNWEFLIDETTLPGCFPTCMPITAGLYRSALTLFLERLPARLRRLSPSNRRRFLQPRRFRTGWRCWLRAALCYTNSARPWLETGTSPSN